MSELQWYALADIILKSQDESIECSCLCTRVFIRHSDDSSKRTNFSIDFTPSDEDEPLLDEEVVSECNSLPHILKNKAKQQDTEPETVSCVSCYCSASHTDNLSTDEHDSLRDSHDSRSAAPIRGGLQSSDSGADLTECIRHDFESDWQKHWSNNGEKLIWESWIAKYSAYINPDYFQEKLNEQQSSQTRFNYDKRTLLAFNSADSEPKEFQKRTLVRNLSGSDDKINGEVSEGWNPLSPLSIDCETEAEQLLSGSRCGSLRTVDSMTNVTRMTISSIELSQSSSDSESFSSVSSVQSSLSSTHTSSEENEDDYQHQWNVLWKTHYEEEYLRQYELYKNDWSNINNLITPSVETVENFSPIHTLKQKRKNYSRKFDIADNFKPSKKLNNQIVQSLGHLLSNLRMADEKVKIDDCMKSVSDAEAIEQDEELNQMASMGLPTSFFSSTMSSGKKRTLASVDSVEKNDCDDFDSTRKRIKAAFNLLGVAYEEPDDKKLGGVVNYKMKHIRLQNRHLKLRNESVKPKHIHFDDDESDQYEEANSQQTSFQGILLDTSDDKLSSGDEEKISSPKSEDQLEELPKRKKRKKKFPLPPEIRDNDKLRKYWHRRFHLFSKFDEGIKLDEESWYSVTPESIAKHIAARCKCNVIIDGFCGAGGNTIQFAQTCQKVIAIDIDPKKIELAINNAKVYGVADKIEFIVGDFFQLVDTLQADVVFFSPPWGGPSYLKQVVYDLDTMLLPVPITELLKAGRKITKNLAIFLPKNSNSFLLLDHTKKGGGVEIEQNFMMKHLVAITAYYNDLIKKI